MYDCKEYSELFFNFGMDYCGMSIKVNNVRNFCYTSRKNPYKSITYVTFLNYFLNSFAPESSKKPYIIAYFHPPCQAFSATFCEILQSFFPLESMT